MPRVRTAKKLAKRINLQYFKELHGFRRWRLWLSIAIPLLAGGWLLAEKVQGNRLVYSGGPVSSAHAVLGPNCNLCHVRGASYSAKVEDKACLACHNAPVHQARQTFTPACSSCHLEHKGAVRMAVTKDAACGQCHSDLHVKSGEMHYDPHVTGLDNKHPQFPPLRQGYKDPGTINLNHHAHMQPTVRGPNGQVQMQCSDCHRPTGTNQPWPYSLAVVQPVSPKPVVLPAAETQQQNECECSAPKFTETFAGPYMAPIKYVNQCAACHTLQFDPLIADPAPHGDAAKTRIFVEEKIKQLVKDRPELIHQPITTGYKEQMEATRNFLRPTRDYLTLPTQPTTPQNWVQQRIELAERLLWKKDCKVCHEQTTGEPDTIPTSVKAVIPARWLPNADFDHQAHRMMTCESCHSHISESKLTSDVNLPGIETCRRCHKEQGAMKHAAVGRCYECHSYHDWRKEQPLKGKFDLTTLTSKK